MRRLLLVIVPVVLAGCAAAGTAGTGGGGGAGQAAPPAGEEPRYEADATVLESGKHGPELCVGIVLDSYPPQCGGPPITNWDWNRVEGEERAAGTTWGAYHVVGTYDGARFTVTSVGPSRPAPPPAEDPIQAGCPEPAGGWPQPDPSRATEDDMQAAMRLARSERDFAAAWITYLEPMGNNVAEDPGEFVLNLAFTGELDRHEAQIRERWGGRLCVARKERTYRDLARIQAELDPSGSVISDLGLKILTSNVDEYHNWVELFVLVEKPDTQPALDRRYGAGLVVVDAALRPVP